jgi:predicted transcriptional regulator
VATVHPEASIEEVVESVIYPRGVSEVPVVDGGRFVGMLRLSTIRGRDRSMWRHLTVGDLMSRDAVDESVPPDEQALKVLGRLGSDDRMLAVVEEGRLVGVVSRRDLLRRLQIRMELSR